MCVCVHVHALVMSRILRRYLLMQIVPLSRKCPIQDLHIISDYESETSRPPATIKTTTAAAIPAIITPESTISSFPEEEFDLAGKKRFVGK